MKFKFTPIGLGSKPSDPQGTGRHFFASSIGEWLCNEDIEQLIADMKRSGLPFIVWTVPVPISATYDIRGYRPVVDGAVILGRYDLKE